MQESCCNIPKPKAPKVDYIIRKNKKVWPEDEEMQKQLRCYDEAHTKHYCITEDFVEFLEKELNEYASQKSSYLGEKQKQSLIECMQKKSSIYECNYKIEQFISTVNKAIHKSFQRKPKSFT